MKINFKDIFSIKNYDCCHKCLCILGIKFIFHKNIKRNKKFENMPIDNNKILFKTTSGSYNCNPKYIAEEIIRRKLPYELVWSVNKNILKYIDSFPKNIKLVLENTQEDIKENRTAKIIVENERHELYTSQGYFKRSGQIYIQTFHGSMGFKKVGTDRNDAKYIDWTLAKADSSQIDYSTSNCKWESDIYKRLFFGYSKILEVGHPRNDILFKDNKKIKEKVYKYFEIPKDKKLVLYAPTLREDRDMTCYNLDYKKVEEALSLKFGSEWVLMAKLHPWMLDYQEEFFKGHKIINATTYPDIQELMACADVMVSDYSSCLTDFMLTKRPAFIYATDIEKYDNDRGFYYPLSSSPFSIAKNNSEMVENIENYHSELYNKKVEEFLEDKGCCEDGHASERIVDLIEKIMKGENINA